MFRSLHHCLLHGYHPPLAYKGASVEKQYKDKGGQLPGSGLTTHDRIAECGMILGHVKRLPDPERWTVEARYSPDGIVAVRSLTGVLMPKLAGLTHRHLIHLLTLQILGARVWFPDNAYTDHVLQAAISGQGHVKMHGKGGPNEGGEWRKIERLALADKFGIDLKTIHNKKSAIRPLVDAYRDRADSILHSSLTDAGLLGDTGPRVEIRGPIARGINLCHTSTSTVS